MTAASLNAPGSPSLLKPLTGLRFLAALYVVVLHYVTPLLTNDTQAWVRNLTNNGFTGVSLFFVLSGFILTYSYVDRGEHLRTSRRKFWVARFARIYPVYALSFIVLAPLFLFELTRHTPSLSALVSGGMSIAMVITLTHDWNPETTTFVNGPAWSVSAEAFFYVLFPLAIARFRHLSPRRILAGIAACWLLGLVVPGAYALLVSAGHFGSGQVLTRDGEDWWAVLISRLPILHVPQFLVGVLFGKLFLHQRSQISTAARRSLCGSVLSISSLIAILVVLATAGRDWSAPLENGLLSLAFGTLIFGLALGGGVLAWALSRPWMVLLGEASYAMYLFQRPVWNWGSAVAAKFGHALGISPTYWQETSWFLLCGAVLIVVSLLVYLTFERPSRARLIRLLNGNPSRSLLKVANEQSSARFASARANTPI